MPIGVIDSGVGGFSILVHLEKKFPEAHFIYVKDSAHFPYSEKSAEELKQIAVQNTERLILKHCNPIVVACNTLTVTALAHLRVTFPDTIFIGTVPAAKLASDSLPAQAHVVILATKNTAESEYLAELMQPFEMKTQFTILGSTELVTAIENWDEQKIRAEIATLFAPLVNERPIDGIVLGCTHFPFIESLIAEYIKTPVQFFEPTAGIEKQVLKYSGLFSADEAFQPHRITFTATDATSSAQLAETYARLKTQLLS